MVKKGDTVTWKWGQGSAEGTVEKISYDKTVITSKGNDITRNGTKLDPALVIRQENGTKLIKLESELE